MLIEPTGALMPMSRREVKVPPKSITSLVWLWFLLARPGRTFEVLGEAGRGSWEGEILNRCNGIGT